MYLGLDLGTSGLKAMLVDDDFATVAVAHAALTVTRPHPGWSEQDPAEWIAAAEDVLGQLRARHPDALARLRGIGLSGHMHGAVLLDAADQVLRPCILWNDSRAAAQCETLTARADFHGIGGNLVMAGFTAPKLLWVAEQEPEIFERTARVLLPKDYLRLWLTGEHMSEMSDAAGTLWLDVGARDWSDALLAATGLSRAQMPGLVEGSDVSGHLRGDLARDWGTPARVPVAGGAGDNAATACGMGVMTPGTGFLSLGTSGVLFAASDHYQPNTGDAVHSFCHAVPDTWHQMGVILSASDSLSWLAEVTGTTVPDLAAAMPQQISAPARPTFLPYLSGERTPLNDPAAAGALLGLRRDVDRAELVQAVMEGVALAFADCVRVLGVAGSGLEAAYAVGGGARSRPWLELMAAITGLRLLLPQDGDFGAAFGAAKLAAAVALDRTDAELFSAPAIAAEIAPDPQLAARYAEKAALYRAAYPALKGIGA